MEDGEEGAKCTERCAALLLRSENIPPDRKRFTSLSLGNISADEPTNSFSFVSNVVSDAFTLARGRTYGLLPLNSLTSACSAVNMKAAWPCFLIGSNEQKRNSRRAQFLLGDPSARCARLIL